MPLLIDAVHGKQIISHIYHIQVISDGDAITDDAIHGVQVVSHIYHQFLNLTEMALLMMQSMVSKSYHIFTMYR